MSSYTDKNSILIIRSLSVIIWIICTGYQLVGMLTVPFLYQHSYGNSLLSGMFSQLAGFIILSCISTIIFAFTFPHWSVLLIAVSLLRKLKKDDKTIFIIIFISNLFFLTVWRLLDSSCILDFGCYSEGSLTSGAAIIKIFFYSQIFCTLPFVYFLNKYVDKRQKRQSSLAKHKK